jgi:K+/H+ antiporter YhaU regulatory subunit KhtT
MFSTDQWRKLSKYGAYNDYALQSTAISLCVDFKTLDENASKFGKEIDEMFHVDGLSDGDNERLQDLKDKCVAEFDKYKKEIYNLFAIVEKLIDGKRFALFKDSLEEKISSDSVKITDKMERTITEAGKTIAEIKIRNKESAAASKF